VSPFCRQSHQRFMKSHLRTLLQLKVSTSAHESNHTESLSGVELQPHRSRASYHVARIHCAAVPHEHSCHRCVPRTRRHVKRHLQHLQAQRKSAFSSNTFDSKSLLVILTLI